MTRFKIQKKDIGIISLLLLAIVLATYLQTHPVLIAQLTEKLYPLRARAALRHIECSPGSPLWLADVLRYSTLKQNAPANQIAYIDPQGDVSHCESGYMATPWFSEKLTPQTRMRYASVTKVWTSDAILQLINQGKLSLDTRILDILDGIPTPKDPRWRAITVGHLLTHRGGFDRQSIFSPDMFTHGQPPACPNHLDKLVEQPLRFDPGSKTAYSNLGYCLLGEVVAKLNNKPFTSTMEDNYHLAADNIIFLENHRFADEPEYNHIETELTGVGDIYTAYDYPALASSAGLSGSALSLVRQTKKMLSNKSELSILSQPEFLSCGNKVNDACYGYAMNPYQPTPDSLKVYFRDGALLGMSSLLMVDEKGGVLALLSNGRPKDFTHEGEQKKIYIYQRLQKQYQ